MKCGKARKQCFEMYLNDNVLYSLIPLQNGSRIEINSPNISINNWILATVTSKTEERPVILYINDLEVMRTTSDYEEIAKD